MFRLNKRALDILNSTCHIYTSSEIATLQRIQRYLSAGITENDHQLMETNVNILFNLQGSLRWQLHDYTYDLSSNRRLIN